MTPFSSIVLKYHWIHCLLRPAAGGGGHREIFYTLAIRNDSRIDLNYSGTLPYWSIQAPVTHNGKRYIHIANSARMRGPMWIKKAIVIQVYSSYEMWLHEGSPGPEPGSHSYVTI